MIILLVMLAAVWLIGLAMGAPKAQRRIMMAIVLGAWIIFQFLLPEGNPTKVSSRHLAQSVVAVGLLGVGGYFYRGWLGGLKARATPLPGAEPPGPMPTAATARPDQMGEAELERYARHIILREIGGAGQKRLRAARVLVVGAGGLGAPVLQYLAASGVGTIGVIDPDLVERTNLQRQVIHTEGRIGMPKVFSAAEAMQAQNPHMEVRPYHRAFEPAIAGELLADYDLVIDGTDSIEARYAVNRAAVARGIPLVSGALSPWEGQVSVFDPAVGGPCYACVFPVPPEAPVTCAEAGVAAPLPGVVGAMMAVEALKCITGAGETLAGRMLIYDALYAQTRVLTAKRREDCAVCGAALV